MMINGQHVDSTIVSAIKVGDTLYRLCVGTTTPQFRGIVESITNHGHKGRTVILGNGEVVRFDSNYMYTYVGH